MTRQERIAIHKKQERLQVRFGVPIVSELKEGVPVLRSTVEGVVEYVRYNGVLYKNVLDKSDAKSETSFGDDGYLIMPNGFILQWGQVTATSTTETVTFPIPFPHRCLNITCTDYASGDDTGITSATGISTLPTTTTVIFSCYNSVDTFFWQAIGH